jgi:hypothetical protein
LPLHSTPEIRTDHNDEAALAVTSQQVVKHSAELACCTLITNILTCIDVNTVKLKVKLALEQATKAQRGSRGNALLFP